MVVLFGPIAQQLAALAAFSLFSLACWYYWSHRKILRVAWMLPTVIPAFPVIGHGYLIVRGFHWMINFGINLLKGALITGGYDKGVLWVGPYPFFIISDPEEVHILLNGTKSFKGGIENKFLGYALGNGLITAPVNVWKVTRRHVNPLFHPRNLEQLLPALNLCARDLVTSLTGHVSQDLVDIEPLVYPIALKSSCMLIYGPDTEVDMESYKFKNLMLAITRISQLAAERFVKFYLWPDPLFRFFYRNDLKKIEQGCDDFIVEAIEDFRRRRKKSSSTYQQTDTLEFSINGQSEEETPQITLEDTYDALRKNYPNFTEKDMHYEMRNILLGGSESTRITLSSCLLALAANPHIQERLYAEVIKVTGSQDSDVTVDDIRAMTFLDQVLKETLRKFLVIPLVTRKVQEDVQLNDLTIPAGALVGIFPAGVHLNPNIYPDPERFDPDRFSPENVAARGNHTFIPFSSGPRNCIGKNYSMLVLKTLMVHVVRRFTFSTTVDIDSQSLVGGVITAFTDGYRVQVELRH